MSNDATLAGKLSKNQKRRLKKKVSKSQKSLTEQKVLVSSDNETTTEETDDVVVEYVSAPISEIIADDPLLEQFSLIFQKFATAEELTSENSVPEVSQTEVVKIKEEFPSSLEQVNQGEEIEPKKLSKKKKKLMSRLSVAELKQLVQRPDVVEAHDVTASDPRLLVYLKAYRNTVPIPRHWCHKRKYLQGKRGIEKPPFELPDFIAETGIAKIRESVMEQESLKKSKQKARDKLQPKMGKIDIDYQVGTTHPATQARSRPLTPSPQLFALHDFFFRFSMMHFSSSRRNPSSALTESFTMRGKNSK